MVPALIVMAIVAALALLLAAAYNTLVRERVRCDEAWAVETAAESYATKPTYAG